MADASATEPVRVGLTLPTFVEDPEMLAEVARAADATGSVDAVFTFDHLFRIDSRGTGPALSLEPTLGLLAAETRRVSFGAFVARASARHAATLRAVFDTAERIAPGRFIAGVGAGDARSDPEQEMFGLPTGGQAVRLGALEATVDALHDASYPLWVGGRSDRILATAAAFADGWNGWGLSVGGFSLEVRRLEEACAVTDRRGRVASTWAGLVELREDGWAEARERPDVLAGPFDHIVEVLRAYTEAGARWLILAPLDSRNPENPQVVGEEIVPHLS